MESSQLSSDQKLDFFIASVTNLNKTVTSLESSDTELKSSVDRVQSTSTGTLQMTYRTST